MNDEEIIEMSGLQKAADAIGAQGFWGLLPRIRAVVREAERREREACAEKTGEFARKWWSIHCASNKHMETTRKAHDDFCALQAVIRARGNK